MSDAKSNDPLHGVTLAKILDQLIEVYTWQELGDLVPINCFRNNPSIKSSLQFLRRTPWARAEVEQLYLKTVAHDFVKTQIVRKVLKAPKR